MLFAFFEANNNKLQSTATAADKKACVFHGFRYYYFSGRPEEAARMMEPHLTETDTALRLSADFVYAFASLANDRIACARRALEEVEQMVAGSRDSDEAQQRAMSSFVARSAAILLHLPVKNSAGSAAPGDATKSSLSGDAKKTTTVRNKTGILSIGDAKKTETARNTAGSPASRDTLSASEMLKLLPPGLRIFGCYIEAHACYLHKDYSRSIGIAETALALQLNMHPIPTIYLYLVEAMDYMGLKKQEKAKRQLLKAWKIAQPDNLIEPFAEHHGLLAGALEATLKKEWPEDFKRIISLTYSFSAGWRKVHNRVSGNDVADNLTTTEFAVAMLAARGWTNQEISAHMEISAHTVNAHIRSVLRKLNITKRSELKQYMLR